LPSSQSFCCFVEPLRGKRTRIYKNSEGGEERLREKGKGENTTPRGEGKESGEKTKIKPPIPSLPQTKKL